MSSFRNKQKKKTLEYNSYLDSRLWSKGHKKKYVAFIHDIEMRYNPYNIYLADYFQMSIYKYLSIKTKHFNKFLYIYILYYSHH